MGLSMDDNGAIFLSTFDGFFERKLKGPQAGSVQRVNKNNETINVMRFNILAGKLTKVEYKSTEKYGDFWSITIVDDQVYKLDLSVNSSSTFYFLNRLINAELDLKAPIELKIFAEVEDDKKKNIILIKQGGKSINGVYTKDNPQDLPPMEEIMFKGKLQWDSTKRDQFMREIIEKYVVPELPTVAATASEPLDGPADDAPDEEMPDWAKGSTEAAKPATPPPATKPAAKPAAAKPATPAPATPAAKPAAKARGAK